MISAGRTLRRGLGVASVGVALLVIFGVAVFLRAPTSPKPGEGEAAPATGIGGRAPVHSNNPVVLEVVASQDPEEAATGVLARKYAVTCMNVSDVLIREDPERLKRADAVVASKNFTTGWIVEGESFLGDALGAAKAFNASDAFGDESSIWIVVGGTKPTAMEIRAAKSPGNHTVWAPTNYITPC